MEDQIQVPNDDRETAEPGPLIGASDHETPASAQALIAALIERNTALEDQVARLSAQLTTADGGFSCLATHADAAQLLADQAGASSPTPVSVPEPATTDLVTGLPNRASFQDRLTDAVQQSERYGESFAVLFIDLDHFKNVNDTMGHSAGDELLAVIAARLTACVRRSDTVARLGGDEFTIILRNLKDPELIGRVAGKIVRALSEPYQIGGRDFYLSASIGVARYPLDGSDVEMLVRNADIAMYEVKKNGKNGFHFYTESMSDRAIRRMELEDELRKAISQGDLEVYYQASVDTFTQETVSAEALIRWQHPERGLIMPDDFIPLAEENGLIVVLDQLVLREACRQASAWQRAGYEPISIAVNLSMRQFEQVNLIDTIMETLVASNLDSRWLELELTESAILENAESAKAILESLRQVGISISIDDFGTGYSSLIQLRRLPIDCLKIDRAFIHGISHDPDGASIVEAIIALGRKLNLTLVAEGVETMAQLEFLRDLGCQRSQGYLFGEPMPAEQFAATMLKMRRDGDSPGSAGSPDSLAEAAFHLNSVTHPFRSLGIR